MPKTLREIGAIGVLKPHDLKEFSAGAQRVFNLMRTGAWYNAEAIRQAAGKNGLSASEGLRRMRELRNYFTIDRRRIQGSRMFEYRISAPRYPDPEQMGFWYPDERA
jgi:hypothetical protein